MRIPEILEKYDSVFHDIVRIKDNKNDNELYVKFSMKPGIVLDAQKPKKTEASTLLSTKTTERMVRPRIEIRHL